MIGTYQHIVAYKWIPEWLGEELDKYKGYDPSVDPQIEQFFQTAAMRFGNISNTLHSIIIFLSFKC